ncbi:MAG: DMT family transporter [Proteobacteria bacterium]|nr:DMT family transporter [Pseudomonadota bacterium]
MGVTLALCSMICFGSNILISRLAMARMEIELGFFIVLAVNILFASTVFGVEYMLRTTPFAWHWKEAGMFALGGFIGTYLGRRFMFDMVRVLGPARASVVHSSAPAFTLLAAWLLVDEKLGAYELALMVLVILGLWTTQPSGKGASTEHRPGRDVLRKGALIGLATVVGFSLGNVCRGYAMRTWNEAVFGTIIASAAALVCQLVATRDWGKAWRGILASDRKGMVLFMWCGIATAGGAMFLVSAMHYMEISLATLVTHTTPLMIFPVSLFWFKNREGLSLRTAVGAGMVLAGLVLLALR